MPAKTALRIGGREVAVSNPQKVLWPREGYTKNDLVEYYRSVARWLLPHLRDRPLTMQRYPDGIDAESFFEKQAPRFTPDWIATTTVAAESGARNVTYVLCNDDATLVWCANLAAIVLHVWYSHLPTLEHPDYTLFDLDPWEGCTLKTLATVALSFGRMLEEIGLKPLVKTSGGTGLHVVLPLRPKYSFDEVRQFGEIVARRVAEELPEATTLERSLARRRKGTVYLDYVQVGRGKTVVPPYVVRARDGAPVSMPLEWDEIRALARKRTADPAAAFAAWNIGNARSRLESKGDLWAAKHWKPASLDAALREAKRRWRF